MEPFHNYKMARARCTRVPLFSVFERKHTTHKTQNTRHKTHEYTASHSHTSRVVRCSHGAFGPGIGRVVSSVVCED